MSQEPTIADVLGAVSSLRSDMQTGFDDLKTTIFALAKQTDDHFTEVKADIAVLKTDVAELKTDVKRIDTKLDRHGVWIEALEDRHKRRKTPKPQS